MRKILILIVLLTTFSGYGQDERNKVSFDSLVLIIKTDSLFIANVISEVLHENDSIGNLMSDMLALSFDVIVAKYNFNFKDEKAFIASLVFTTEAIKTMKELFNEIEINSFEYKGDDFEDTLKMNNEVRQKIK